MDQTQYLKIPLVQYKYPKSDTEGGFPIPYQSH